MGHAERPALLDYLEIYLEMTLRVWIREHSGLRISLMNFPVFLLPQKDVWQAGRAKEFAERVHEVAYAAKQARDFHVGGIGAWMGTTRRAWPLSAFFWRYTVATSVDCWFPCPEISCRWRECFCWARVVKAAWYSCRWSSFPINGSWAI